MNNLMVYGGEILSVQGKKKCVILFEIEAPSAVPGAAPLSLRAPMMCDTNYRDAILCLSVPVLQLIKEGYLVRETKRRKNNQEADPNGKEKSA